MGRNHYQSSADTNIDVGNPLRTVHSIHQEQNVQGPEVNNCFNDDNDIQINDADHEDVSVDMEVPDNNIPARPSMSELSEQYVKELAVFFMRLQGKLILPASLIDEIVSEMDALHEVDHEMLRERLQVKMESIGISKQNSSVILSEFDVPDPWTKNVREGCLATTYLREKYFAEHFT